MKLPVPSAFSLRGSGRYTKRRIQDDYVLKWSSNRRRSSVLSGHSLPTSSFTLAVPIILVGFLIHTAEGFDSSEERRDFASGLGGTDGVVVVSSSDVGGGTSLPSSHTIYHHVGGPPEAAEAPGSSRAGGPPGRPGSATGRLSESPLTERWAVIDGQVTLPCDVTPPYPGDSPILVLISKEKTPIYSVDARDGGSFNSARQWSDEGTLGSRATFVMTDGGGLLIQSVRRADQSDYHCRVEFHDSPTRNSRVRLHLIVAPSPPVIMDESGTELKGVIGPYKLGDTITLSCSVTGGYPKPSVTWWHESFLLDDTSEVTEGEATVNRIVLPNLTRQHLNRRMTCQGSNSNLTKPVLTSVVLNMSFPPATVDIVRPEVGSLSVGQQYTFSCMSAESRPPAALRWSKDDQPIRSNVRDMIVSGQMQSTLLFTPQREDNGRALVCRGVNPHIPDVVKEDTRILDIRYPPQLNLSLGKSLNTRKIKEGDDVYFECDVSGNPEVTSVQWYHNGTEIQDDKSKGVIVSFKNLVLQNIHRNNSGTYSCGAANAEGRISSNVFTLNIHYAPVCSSEQQWVYGSGRRELVNITCSVESYPLPHVFSWALNTSSTELLDVPRSHTNNNELSSVLTYTPHTPLDYGSLLCWAENSVGRQRAPCVFQVVPAAVPESVHNCSVWHNNSATGQVVIRCWPGWNGGLEQTFSLEVRDGETGAEVASLKDQLKPRFTVTGLKPGEEYVLEVTATNSQGAAPSVTLTHLTPIDIAEKRLSKTPGDSGGVGVPTIVGVLVGALSVLFLCCVMAAILIKVRNSSRRGDVSTRLRGSQASSAVEDDENDKACRKSDGEPDVILVTSSLSTDPKTADLQQQVKSHQLLGMSPTASAVTGGGNTDIYSSAAADALMESHQSRVLTPSPPTMFSDTPFDRASHQQRCRQSMGLSTSPRLDKMSVHQRHQYYPDMEQPDHFLQQQQQPMTQYLSNQMMSTSMTLPSKKKFHQASDFSNLLDAHQSISPTQLNSMDNSRYSETKASTLRYKDKVGSLHVMRSGMSTSPSFPERDSSGLGGVGPVGSRVSTTDRQSHGAPPSTGGIDRSTKTGLTSGKCAKVDSPQRESVV